jgi:hypothetical protein
MPDQQVLIKPRPWLTGWRPVAVDGALVACLLALSRPVIITGTLAARALQVAVALATTLPLVVRRRWPLTVFAAVALAAFGQWLGRITLRPHDLAVLLFDRGGDAPPSLLRSRAGGGGGCRGRPRRRSAECRCPETNWCRPRWW